jgi:hypothetical protein
VDLARPYASVSPTLEGDVLAVLARTTGGLSGRETARLAPRGSQRGILSALERLVDQGVVIRADVGSSFQYSLNREHLAAPAVEVLASMRTVLWERLRTVIAAWDPPVVHASVFGSAARGDGDAAGDIDLLLVLTDDLDTEDPVWREQVAQLGDQVLRWTGNHAGIAELAISGLPVLATERPELADNLRSDAITLAGPSVATLLEAS